MSVVVAVKKDNIVYIGADSQCTCNGTKICSSNINNLKIWSVRGVENCVIGHVGSVREANLIKTNSDYIFKDEGKIDFDFIVNCVVENIYNLLDSKKLIYKDSDDMPMMHSRFLICYENKIYKIGKDFAVIEIDECTALGSAELEATGSLYSSKGEDPIVRISKAIKVAACNDIYVSDPIIIMNTYDHEVEILKI